MKIYVIQSGCIFEGGAVNAVSTKQEKALKELENMVSIAIKNELEGVEWHEERPNYWVNGYDFISMTEMEEI